MRSSLFESSSSKSIQTESEVVDVREVILEVMPLEVTLEVTPLEVTPLEVIAGGFKVVVDFLLAARRGLARTRFVVSRRYIS